MADEIILPDDLISTSHAARLARLHISGIRRWIKSGKVHGYRSGGRLWVSRAELMAQWQTAGEVAAERAAGQLLPSTRRQERAQARQLQALLRAKGIKV